MGNGCTSGHGICGLARFSWRSLAAVITFFVVALVTASVAHIAFPHFSVLGASQLAARHIYGTPRAPLEGLKQLFEFCADNRNAIPLALVGVLVLLAMKPSRWAAAKR